MNRSAINHPAIDHPAIDHRPNSAGRSTRKNRVYLLARSQLVAESVARALARESKIELVDVALFRSFSIARLRSKPCDVILIDSASHTAEALDWIREISDGSPHDAGERKCLALGIEPREAVDFIENGAAGFTLRTDCFTEVGQAIDDVAHDRACCAPDITFQVIARLRQVARERPELSATSAEQLSRRELQVLALLARGLRNKEIAGHLNIAAATARNHIQKIFGKLNVHRRADAVRMAFERGLVLEVAS